MRIKFHSRVRELTVKGMATVLALLVSASGVAAPVVVSLNQRVTNTSSTPRTDFHLVITSDSNTTVVSDTLNGAPPNGAQGNPGISGNGSRHIELNWTQPIAAFGSVDLRVQMTQEHRNEVRATAFFTPHASPTDIPLLGWRVEDDGRVFLQNAMSEAISFDRLRFQLPGDLDNATIDELFANPGAGLVGLLSAGIVPGGLADAPGELLVGQFDLMPGDFLSATFSTSFVDPGFSELMTDSVLGHEHPAPEPPLAALQALALAASVSWWRRRRGGQRLSASSPAPCSSPSERTPGRWCRKRRA